jgi:hypothetical protein
LEVPNSRLCWGTGYPEWGFSHFRPFRHVLYLFTKITIACADFTLSNWPHVIFCLFHLPYVIIQSSYFVLRTVLTSVFENGKQETNTLCIWSSVIEYHKTQYTLCLLLFTQQQFI